MMLRWASHDRHPYSHIWYFFALPEGLSRSYLGVVTYIKIKKKGGAGEKGIVPPPLWAELIGDALPSRSHKLGEGFWHLHKVRLYVNTAYYMSTVHRT